MLVVEQIVQEFAYKEEKIDETDQVPSNEATLLPTEDTSIIDALPLLLLTVAVVQGGVGVDPSSRLVMRFHIQFIFQSNMSPTNVEDRAHVAIEDDQPVPIKLNTTLLDHIEKHRYFVLIQ